VSAKIQRYIPVFLSVRHVCKCGQFALVLVNVMENFNYGILISRTSVAFIYVLEENKKLKTPTMIIDNCSK